MANKTALGRGNEGIRLLSTTHSNLIFGLIVLPAHLPYKPMYKTYPCIRNPPSPTDICRLFYVNIVEVVPVFNGLSEVIMCTD